MTATKNSKHGTVYPFLDRRKAPSGSLYPVKLTVNIKGNQFRIGIKLHTTPDMFKRATSWKGSVPKDAKQLKADIDVYLQKARDILKNYPQADQQMFTNLFKSEADLKHSGKTDLSVLFKQKIDELTKEDRAGSIFFYNQAMEVFKRFNKDFYLEDITESYLKEFAAWWVNRDNSIATAQIYFRCLRHIFNRAIKDGYIAQGHYPFKDFSIGTSSRSKSVLYAEQLKALWEYQPNGYGETRSKDYFFFLYLCNGMNLKDALLLKASDIHEETIRFVRKKTSKTKKDTKEIVVYLHPEARRIITEWGNSDGDSYIFPCLNDTKNDIERKHRKDIFARNLNRDLKRIGRKLKFKVPLNLNLARHSFATRLKLDGVPVSFISDAMGHGDTRTTEHYLKSLPDSSYKKISDSLLSF
jgi:integrase